MRDLLILRHGETTWNREGRLQGGLDAPLTALGRVQAARQGAILRSLGGDRPVLCSPQGRARTTAALAGLRLRVESGLREVGMGRWEGRSRAEIAPPAGLLWKLDAPGGERLAAFVKRLDAFLARCPSRAILVTHGVVAVALRARLLGQCPETWKGMDDPQGVVFRILGDDEVLIS
ncbi:MAG: histidine phosphatase family protein [Pseudomonadota bacterium]